MVVFCVKFGCVFFIILVFMSSMGNVNRFFFSSCGLIFFVLFLRGCSLIIFFSEAMMKMEAAHSGIALLRLM